MKALPAAKLITVKDQFELELGQSLSILQIAYETWGELNDDKSNAVLAIPAFSAHSHAKSSEADKNPGWWEHMIGPGLPLDTNQYFVICASLLGGCHGTTGPQSEKPGTPGQSYQGDFPLLTIGDIARAHLALMDALEISQLHAVCGGSMGAMQALYIGVHHSDRCRRVAAISGTNHTRPATAAIRHLGRRSIMLDPAYKDGFYGDQAPEAGVHLAREIGTVFYRSKSEFNERFSWDPINIPSLAGATFDVQSYLNHQGKKMAGQFDANSYLRLSLAMDLFDFVGPAKESGLDLSDRDVDFHIAGVEEDRLMPLSEQQSLHKALMTAGARSSMTTFSSPVGHDAFLVKHEGIAEFYRNALA